MKLHKEQERICRDLGYVEGLALSLANQALSLAQQDLRVEGSRAVDEAYDLASKGSYGLLVAQIQEIKERIGL